MSQSIQLFYSYSHKDEELRNALETHLSILRRQGAIIDWHDRKILASENWETEIDAHIDDADIVLLLVSPDFIASDYCYGRELGRALVRHEAGKTKIVPIILRPVDWTGAPFAKFEALPKDGKPITTWANYDEAWLDVSKGVRRLVESILSLRTSITTAPDPVQAIVLLRDEFLRIEAAHGRPSGIGGASTGLQVLDRTIDGIHKADIVLICGRPSMGKGDLALNIASQLAKETSLPALFFSMRLSGEQVTRRLLAAESKVSIHRLVRGILTDLDWLKLVNAAGALGDVPIFIDASTESTEVEIARRIGKVMEANQLGLVVVDGVEHITSAQNYTTPRREIRAVVKALRKLAVDYEVPIVLTATTAPQREPRPDNPATITDLEDWEPLASDAANVVLIVYRPHDYWMDGPNKGIAIINVEKNPYGGTGYVRLGYRDDLCTFENLAEEE